MKELATQWRNFMTRRRAAKNKAQSKTQSSAA
jgi:hypothetical protein